jgi:nucleotide-binding universal stress UspA family protein
VFHAYMPLVSIEPVAIAAAPLVLMPPEVEEARAQQVMRTVGQLADRAGIPAGRCHIRMGEVASQLAAFARRNGAAIVVMGAVSRSAIVRLFIGSAAERTLEVLGCDVLIVKPRSFRSSVQRQPADNTRSPRRRRSRGSAVAMQAMPLPLL